VDIVLPTVDAELRPLAHARDEFTAAGIDLLLAPAAALEVILDKLLLAQHCTGIVRVPRTELFGPAVDPASWTYPVIVKPRTGSGSRGILGVTHLARPDLARRTWPDEPGPTKPGPTGFPQASPPRAPGHVL
jgi:carbamoylphosphate synthase large subunit